MVTTLTGYVHRPRDNICPPGEKGRGLGFVSTAMVAQRKNVNLTRHSILPMLALGYMYRPHDKTCPPGEMERGIDL